MISQCGWTIIFFALCIDGKPSSGDISQQAKCYVKTSSLKIIEGNICSIKYDIEGCVPADVYPDLDDTTTGAVEIHQTKNEASISVIDISLSPLVPGSATLVLNGLTKSKESRCVSVKFRHVVIPPNQSISLHLDNLMLLEGFYNLTGTNINSASNQDSFNTIFIHKGFDVPNRTPLLYKDKSDLSDNEEPDIRKNRKRKEIRHIQEKVCTCNNCISTSHQYFSDSGLLRFYYNLTDGSCTNFTVSLLKYVGPSIQTEESCLKNRIGIDTLKQMAHVGPTRLPDKAPMDFPNTQTGCYLIRTFQGEFHGFFWLDAENITDMNTWNTSILLTPRNDEDSCCLSLEVSWNLPEFPFNFTYWKLALWYSDDEMSCEGKDLNTGKITVIETEEDVLDKNTYTFTNLTEAYHCARLTPIDYRCPSDGCDPRSTKTIFVKRPIKEPLDGPRDVTYGPSLWLIVFLIAIGIVVTVLLSIFCYWYKKRWYKPQTSYSSVPLDLRQLERISVLVIWTRFGLNKNTQFEPIVAAFKDLLRRYSGCKVYDYLDISELDKKQRQFLMNNPIEWLQSHLKDPLEKIILVGSEGARLKQDLQRIALQKEQESKIKSDEYEDPLDALLFPYVLRYLQESKDLASDYSRIFHIRFPDVNESELDGIVPWMRFSIPQHLRNLTLKLRGLSEELATDFPSPSEEQLQRIQTLITNSNQIHNNTDTLTNKVNGWSHQQ